VHNRAISFPLNPPGPPDRPGPAQSPDLVVGFGASLQREGAATTVPVR
jgi:hypothetical protein